MYDHPEPTEEEQEQSPERRREEDAMRGPGHEAPAEQRPTRDSGQAEGPTPEDVGVPDPPEPAVDPTHEA